MNQWKVGQIRVKSGYTPAPNAQVGAAPGTRDPNADRQMLQAIQAAADGRDFGRAAAMAEAALRNGLEHPMVLNLAALKYEQDGRFDDALAVLERAIQIEPDDIGAHNAKGLVLTRLERYAEALATFDGVVAMMPDFAGAHCARGASLESLGRLNEAEAAHRRALELDPDNLGAMQGVANLLSRRGEHAEARPLAEAVLEAAPNFPDAVMVLAGADAAEGHGERARQRLEMLAGDARLTPHQRALAQGQLGDVLDAQDLTAEAFAAYEACNQGLLAAYAPVHGRGAGALAFARAMLTEMDAIPADRWRGAPSPAPADGPKTHVFLTGFPRSGTTLLEQVLASHPEVVALEERETLEAAQRAFQMKPEDVARLAHATEAELQPLRDAYWARVGAEGGDPAGKVFVDKHPLHTFRLPLILKLFPDAKILFARRDPRDVVLSCYRRRFAMSGSAYQLLTLPGAAGYYDAAMSLAEKLQPAMAANTLVVRHESLVDGFDAAVREVCDFLGLPWADSMRDFAQKGRDRAVATPSGAQLSRGLSAEGVGAWRRYSTQMAAVAPTLRPWAAKFGYDPE